MPDDHHKQDARITKSNTEKPSSYFAQDAKFLLFDLDSVNVKIARPSAINFTTNKCVYRVFLQYTIPHRGEGYANKY